MEIIDYTTNHLESLFDDIGYSLKRDVTIK